MSNDEGEKAGKRKPKATRATARARVDDVLRVMLDGAQFWDIREYVRQREGEGAEPWTIPPGGKPLSNSQLRVYQRRAERVIEENTQADREATIRRHLAQRRALYARAVSTGQLGVALGAAKDEALLLNLYPPARQEVSGPNGGPLVTAEIAATMDPAERVAHVRRLIAAARARQQQRPALPYYPHENGSAANAHESDGAGGPEHGK